MKTFFLVAFLLQGIGEMKLKEGVRVVGLKSEMVLASFIIDGVYKDHGQELVITAGTEGKHSKTSRHYLGYAIDTRTHYFDQTKIPVIQKDIQNAIGDDFLVIFEGDHFHIGFKPKSLVM